MGKPASKEEARQIFELLKTVIASVDPQIAQKLTSVDDLSQLDSISAYRQTVEAVCDLLLERADKSLDEMERPDQPYPQLQVEERPERL